jgi:glycosyltransferase involved in cell wall biosynthesis
MPAPFFSIIIPTLNEEIYIAKLLADLDGQSYADFTVTVVDSESTDQTCSIIRRYARKDTRFHLLKSKAHGVSAQRNLGARNAKTPWLLFLDADTRLPVYFLAEMKTQITKTPYDICTTFAIPDTDTLADKLLLNAHNTLMQGTAFLNKPYAFGACLLCTKIAFDRVNGFDESIHFQEDSDFIQRITKAGMKFFIFPTPEYIFCMRRYTKEGTFNVILKTLPFSLKSFVADSFQTDASSYPMSGGKKYKSKKI